MLKLLDISETKAQLIQFTDQEKANKNLTWAIYRPHEKS